MRTKALRAKLRRPLLKSPWSLNENGHIVEKERYDFEDSTTDANPVVFAFGAVIGLGWSYRSSIWLWYWQPYGLAAGDTVDTAEAGLD